MKYFQKNIYYLLLFIFSFGCSKPLQVYDTSSKNTPIEQLTANDSLSETIILPYREQMQKQMDEVLNTSLVDLEVGCPEGLLGDFIADLTFSRARKESKLPVDFAILNNGGLRVPIYKGDITRRNIYELMPFDNEIVIVEITGEKMIDLIDYVKRKSLMSDSRKAGVPVSSLRMMIHDDEVSRVFIGIREFDKDRNYRVVTSDYLANGGDHMDFFLNPISYETTGVKLRDAIIDCIVEFKEKNLPVNALIDGRIYHAE